MNRICKNLLFKRSVYSPLCTSKRKECDFQYDLSKEIVVTHTANVSLFGINLPNDGNALNDEALITLNQGLNDFNNDDEYSVAILHGIGGNFCKGLQRSANIEHAKELIKTMNNLRKPTIASLTGFSILFGFQLAIMCDIRIMEDTAVFGLGHKKEKDEILPYVSEKLVTITSVSAALDALLSGTGYSYTDALALNLINRVVDCGSGLGKCVNLGRCIAKYPLEEILTIRKNILTLSSNSRTS